jgi:hypothetical protein
MFGCESVQEDWMEVNVMVHQYFLPNAKNGVQDLVSTSRIVKYISNCLLDADVRKILSEDPLIVYASQGINVQICAPVNTKKPGIKQMI